MGSYPRPEETPGGSHPLFHEAPLIPIIWGWKESPGENIESAQDGGLYCVLSPTAPSILGPDWEASEDRHMASLQEVPFRTGS